MLPAVMVSVETPETDVPVMFAIFILTADTDRYPATRPGALRSPPTVSRTRNTTGKNTASGKKVTASGKIAGWHGDAGSQFDRARAGTKYFHRHSSIPRQ